MLPAGTVLASLLSVLEGVRLVFTAPTFITFTQLVTGLLAATGPRTVTGMWGAAGLAGVSHHARAHRFFSDARWSPDALGLALARLVVARLVDDGRPLRVGIDDTLFHRYGSKTHGVFWQHDGSAKGRDGIGRGNCFVVAGLIVTLPFMARQVCLPVLFRLYIPKNKSGISKPDLARELVGLVAAAFPGRQIDVVVDAAYRGPAWRTPFPAKVTFTTRLASNAVLYGPRPPRTGRRGRPRLKGDRLGTPRGPGRYRHLAAHPGAPLRQYRHRADRGDPVSVVGIAVHHPGGRGAGQNPRLHQALRHRCGLHRHHRHRRSPHRPLRRPLVDRANDQGL
ncbi:IS701 family transposase [Saccharopolyspora hattusasensis]|uniref:IS701 family transposase n=1 Tax=Saccharopolyspora hattusasensis TaxID=1128679 RepID=UPI003D956231